VTEKHLVLLTLIVSSPHSSPRFRGVWEDAIGRQPFELDFIHSTPLFGTENV